MKNKLLILFVIVVPGCLVYYFLDPSSVPMLRCPLHLITGLSCPLCGLQRAIHSFLHLQPLQAIGYNYFLVLLLPLSILYLLSRNGHAPCLARFFDSKATQISMIVLAIAWCVVRNIYKI